MFLFVFLFLIFLIVQKLRQASDKFMRHLSRTTFPSNEICWALTFNCLDFVFPWDTSSFEVLKITEKFCPFLKRKPSISVKPNFLFVKMLIPHSILKYHKIESFERSLWHHILHFIIGVNSRFYLPPRSPLFSTPI